MIITRVGKGPFWFALAATANVMLTCWCDTCANVANIRWQSSETVGSTHSWYTLHVIQAWNKFVFLAGIRRWWTLECLLTVYQRFVAMWRFLESFHPVWLNVSKDGCALVNQQQPLEPSGTGQYVSVYIGWKLPVGWQTLFIIIRTDCSCLLNADEQMGSLPVMSRLIMSLLTVHRLRIRVQDKNSLSWDASKHLHLIVTHLTSGSQAVYFL